jgi:signal transduction histidine kinase
MWFDRLRTNRVDAALAAAFTVLGLVQVAVVPIAAAGIAELFVLGSTLPLAWRRTWPVESSIVSAAFWVIPLHGFPVLGLVVVVLQFFALGSYAPSRRAAIAVTTWAAAASVVGTLLGPEDPIAVIGAVLAVVAPVLAGRLYRHQRKQTETLKRLAVELEAERTKAEQAAVSAERARIAQELHDVVGHEMTLIAIQAEATKAALTSAPERAAQPVETIRSTAHRTLAEMRAVLNVLTAPDTDRVSIEAPQEIAARARAAGIENDLRVTGTPTGEHGPVALAVNRILRECLTNAGRHAPGQRVDVHIEWAADAVEIRSSNPIVSTNGYLAGRGLNGIRHRAELLGGTFSAQTRDGRFDVRVRIPTGASG